MTLEEFEKFIQTYGTISSRWPIELRTSAEKFVTGNPSHAQHIMDAEGKLDAALDNFGAPATSDLTRQRILNAVAVPVPSDAAPAVRKPVLWRAVAATFIGAFALGFAGANMLQTSGGESQAIQLADNSIDTSLQETAGDLGLSDIYEWTHGTDS